MAINERSRDIRRVLLGVLVLNWAVALGKGIVGHFSNSLSVEADAFHSLLDGASNIVGLISITLAAAEPDQEHPYGHRKFEVLGALAIGGFLALTAVNILQEAWTRLKAPEEVTVTWVAYVVMGGTMAANILITWYEQHRGRALQSEVLLADAAHTRTDVLATAGVIVSLVAVRFGIRWLDVVVAVGIAALIAWAAVRVALSGARVLADRAVLNPEEVRTTALSVRGVLECHEIRTRGTPDSIFADLRIHLEARLALTEAHDIAHAVESALKSKYPGLRDVVVHVEPHEHHKCM